MSRYFIFSHLILPLTPIHVHRVPMNRSELPPMHDEEGSSSQVSPNQRKRARKTPIRSKWLKSALVGGLFSPNAISDQPKRIVGARCTLPFCSILAPVHCLSLSHRICPWSESFKLRETDSIVPPPFHANFSPPPNLIFSIFRHDPPSIPLRTRKYRKFATELTSRVLDSH